MKKKLTLEERNTKVRLWLREHDLLNIARLCRRVNFDRGNFAHFLEGNRDLPEEVIHRLEIALAQYSYQP